VNVNCDLLVSKFAFTFNLYRYNVMMAAVTMTVLEGWQHRLDPSMLLLEELKKRMKAMLAWWGGWCTQSCQVGEYYDENCDDLIPTNTFFDLFNDDVNATS
jgi:hypothetical protein